MVDLALIHNKYQERCLIDFYKNYKISGQLVIITSISLDEYLKNRSISIINIPRISGIVDGYNSEWARQVFSTVNEYEFNNLYLAGVHWPINNFITEKVSLTGRVIWLEEGFDLYSNILLPLPKIASHVLRKIKLSLFRTPYYFWSQYPKTIKKKKTSVITYSPRLQLRTNLQCLLISAAHMSGTAYLKNTLCLLPPVQGREVLDSEKISRAISQLMLISETIYIRHHPSTIDQLKKESFGVDLHQAELTSTELSRFEYIVHFEALSSIIIEAQLVYKTVSTHILVKNIVKNQSFKRRLNNKIFGSVAEKKIGLTFETLSDAEK